MLDKIDLNQKMSKAVFKSEMDELELRLKKIQLELKEHNIPVIVTFEGWGSSGKGTLISKIVYPLDPRLFNVYTMDKVTQGMAMRPYLWSYWTKLPAKGRMSFFDKSWHRILHEAGGKWMLTEKEKKHFYEDINAFEKKLTDDGLVIIKFFLHISKDEQKRRFKELESRNSTSWRVDPDDWCQNNEYDKNSKQFELMISKTNTADSPWHIIEAEDKRYAAAKAYKILLARLEKEINKKATTITDTEYVKEDISILSSIDLSKEISKDSYKENLNRYQSELKDLCYQMYVKRKSVIIVYEGWDAAGKGGNIKRLTQELDPRAYEVVPISAPTVDELSHHYLQRFWTKMPKDGHMAIFDRSWYGRVMVERIEGFCTVNEWRRAYAEINDMERYWSHHGIIVLKFWLHIDKEEQHSRFRLRMNNPLKQYKITDEDWRNREKWYEYEEAVNEMLIRTNTDYAPWIIVESNSKMYARIKVLEYLTKTLRKALQN